MEWGEKWGITPDRVVDLGGPSGPVWAEGEDLKLTNWGKTPKLIHRAAWHDCEPGQHVGLWVCEDGIVCYTTSPIVNYEPRTFDNTARESTERWAEILKTKRWKPQDGEKFEERLTLWKLSQMLDDDGNPLKSVDNTALWKTYGAQVHDDAMVWARDPNPFSGENIALAEEAIRRWQDKGTAYPICSFIGAYPVPEDLDLHCLTFLQKHYWQIELAVAQVFVDKFGHGAGFDDLFLPLSLPNIRSWCVNYLLCHRNPIVEAYKVRGNVEHPLSFIVKISSDQTKQPWTYDPVSPRPVTLLQRVSTANAPWREALDGTPPFFSGR